MCGISGAYFLKSVDSETLRRRITDSLDVLAHRGPNASGIWLSSRHSLGFGHRRLSIVDLSEAGSQPMLCASGRHIITYNGEIYNHLELRAELVKQGWSGTFRGHSDTETLIEAIEFFGLENALVKCRGMFAAVVWDLELQTLSFMRDRAGEKPLYIGLSEGGLAFGSELKALRKLLPGLGEIKDEALSRFLQYGYVQGDESILERVLRLRPGCFLTFSMEELGRLCLSTSSHALPESARKNTKSYWNLAEFAQDGQSRKFKGSFQDAVEELRTRLTDAVSEQMVADVPVGAFLSGGIDSSAIVAIAQELSQRPVNSFSIGFEDRAYDESGFARDVARHLGTTHRELIVGQKDALATIAELSSIYCEPFADSSQIPTILVSRLARQEVTVSLSGDAGDELFGGYQRYFLVPPVWGRLKKIPLPLRSLAASAIQSVSTRIWDRVYDVAEPAIPRKLRQIQVGDRLHKFAGLLAARNPEDLYDRLLSKWPRDGLRDVTTGTMTAGFLSRELVDAMMQKDFEGYLPDDILVKVDRASMSASLESRVPFLDHRIVEFAWTLPHKYLIDQGIGKRVLREVLYQSVPKEFMQRPKMGFGLPIGTWLKGELRDWAEDLLNLSDLKSCGHLNGKLIAKVWSEHVNGRANHQHALWTVLMFRSWQKQWQS